MRLVRGIEGVVAMTSELVIRFDYGLTVPWVSRGPHNELVATAGPTKLVMRTSAHSVGRNMRTLSHSKVAAGESVAFVVQCVSSVAKNPAPCDAQAALERTRAFWSGWAAICRDELPWYKLVQRSLLTLKALTFAETGGIVAAPTTSLPRTHRRRTQLGLSLLLAARFQPVAPSADHSRILGRGDRLARLVGARLCRLARTSANQVWRQRRALPGRTRTWLAARL